MKALFLTSNVGGYEKIETGKVATKWDNSQHFVDRLKTYCKNIGTFAFVASNPEGFEKSDEYSVLLSDALRNDGFAVKKVVVIDHRTKNPEKEILKSDVVFLAGGHTPTQNAYFKEIGLAKILGKFDGVVVGQSAGSINCCTKAYIQPGDGTEVVNQKFIDGMGLVDFAIRPHLNNATKPEFDGKSRFDMCVEDSFETPIYGLYDGSFFEIANSKTTIFGKVVCFDRGKVTEVCQSKKFIEIEK